MRVLVACEESHMIGISKYAINNELRFERNITAISKKIEEKYGVEVDE